MTNTDQPKLCWDSWSRFHRNLVSGFVRFEDTGEMVYTSCNPRPDSRGRFASADVTIVSTRDDRFPKAVFTPDGKKVTRAALGRKGQQTFALDHKTATMVAIGRNLESADAVPLALRRRATVYWPGDGLRPVGSPTKVYVRRVYTPEEQDHIDTAFALARMRWEMLDDATKPRVSAVGAGFQWRKNRKPTPADLLAVDSDKLCAEINRVADGDWFEIAKELRALQPYHNMSELMLLTAAAAFSRHRFGHDYDVTTVPYLTLTAAG